ncbi:putative alcohol dehydrogenase [Diplodia seriata]|uniref:Putative alcohol dehydrogenase n=1 Tax=Diplodia seriata TaxID=420778 RepID=A0A0G2E274_9PEZI|nr:putative alcohol dehydrogenase [Diplodia seriata]
MSTNPESTAHTGETKFEIPKTCKAGVVVNEGPDFRVEIQDVPVPEPGPDEVLLRLNATGLCMSDIHFMANDWAVPPMSTFSTRCAGHEGAGVVVALGSNVKTWKIGDRGGVKPLWDVCGACEQCWTGKENYCQRGVYTGLVATGTYQQYITSPAKYTSPIPEGVADEVAAPVMCSATPAGATHIGADPNIVVFKNLTITGSLVGTMSDTAAALEYARRGLLQPICEVRPLSAMPESVQQLRRGEIAGRVVIDFNQQ